MILSVSLLSQHLASFEISTKYSGFEVDLDAHIELKMFLHMTTAISNSYSDLCNIHLHLLHVYS